MATINPISLALRRVQHIKQHAINVVKNKEQLRNVFAHFEPIQNEEKKRETRKEIAIHKRSEFIKLSNRGESK